MNLKYDLPALLADIDLLNLVSADTLLRRVAGTNGGEWAGPCPLCGGRDRFRVQPNRAGGGRWFCRHCAPEPWHYDAIAYVQSRDGVSAGAAIKRLAEYAGAVAYRGKGEFSSAKATQSSYTTQSPSAEWQNAARELIGIAVAALWSTTGAQARDWLFARGLNETTLRRWQIGFLSKALRCDAKRWGLDSEQAAWIPSGVLIPCEIEGTAWYLKNRRLYGEPKYIHVRGSKPALYGAETLVGKTEALITEGEFDSLLAWQVLNEAETGNGQIPGKLPISNASADNPINGEFNRVRPIGVATLGSAKQVPHLEPWARYLLPLKRLWICYDADDAGRRGAERWPRITSRAQIVSIPQLRTGNKDLTDYVLSGGNLQRLLTCEGDRFTLTLVPDSPLPTIAGRWRRMPSGPIQASYTEDEFALCCEIANMDRGGVSADASSELPVRSADQDLSSHEVTSRNGTRPERNFNL